MPEDITSILGQNTKEEEAKANEDLQAGLGLPSDADDGEGNPLEKMDEISKRTPSKKDAKGKKLDEDAIAEMLMTGDNTDGMFEPEVKDEEDGVKLHEKTDDAVKKNLDKEAEPSEKYKYDFMEDLNRNPHKYKIITPKGEMTVAQAIRKGYDPLTGSFSGRNHEEEIEKEMSKLNDADRSAVESLIHPREEDIAEADREKLGLNPEIFRRDQPAEAEAPVEEAPAQEEPMPAPAEAAATGANDIAALLGGEA